MPKSFCQPSELLSAIRIQVRQAKDNQPDSRDAFLHVSRRCIDQHMDVESADPRVTQRLSQLGCIVPGSASRPQIG